MKEIQDQLNAITGDMSTLKDLSLKVSNVESSVSNIQKKLDENISLNHDVVSLREDYDELKTENKLLRAQLDILTEKVLDLEYHQKRNNLIFEGIVDTQKEPAIESYRKVCDLLAPYCNVAEMKIARCHQLGSYRTGYNRPIIANFMWYGDVTSILSIKSRLPRGLYIKEYIPKTWEDRNRILKPYSTVAKQLEMPAYVSKGKLNIDGAIYTCDSINNIPSAVVDKLNNEKKDNEKLVYFSPQSEFSNMHPSPFTVDNVTYSSAEQYIQSQKASLFNDDATEKKIMLTDSPYEAKKFGHRVAHYDDNKWRHNAERIAVRGVYEKFRQNSKLSQKLLQLNVDLYEGSTDTLWGTGIHVKNQSALQKDRWTSDGLMHRVYEQVKTMLIEPSE